MPSKLRDRLIQLGAQTWGKTPDEIEEKIAARRLVLKHFLELVMLQAHNPITATWIMKYLSPETLERRQHRARRIKQIQQFGAWLQFVKPKDADESAYIEQLKADCKTALAQGSK